MKTSLLVGLFAAIALSRSSAGELSTGPGVSVSDLAQLGVCAASLIYKQDQPFSQLEISLIYKERNKSGGYKEKDINLPSTYPLAQSTTTQALTVLIDKNGSVVNCGTSGHHGKGMDLPPPCSTQMPPKLLKDGNYAWITLLNDSGKSSSEDNIKGILELAIKGTD